MIKKIVLDLDDVLANLVESWNLWMYENGYTDRVLTRQDIRTYDHYVNAGYHPSVFDFYKVHNCYEEWVQPLDGSHLFLEWCQETFDEVMILSYAVTRKCQSDKKAFVKKHFNFDNIQFSSSKKEKHTFTKDSILVDDYPVNVLGHVINNKNHGIIYNKNGENGWSDILDYRHETKNMTSSDFNFLFTATSYKEVENLIEKLQGHS
jgi:5'(3')-deoxyribonucleotidase